MDQEAEKQLDMVLAPRHLRVAMALGLQVDGDVVSGTIVVHGRAIAGYHHSLVEFDRSWRATGPVIEALGISLIYERLVGLWRAFAQKPTLTVGAGQDRTASRIAFDAGWPPANLHPEPLVAACDQIIALWQAGKLRDLLT